MNSPHNAPTPDPRRQEFPDWKAPADDAQMLLWPQPSHLAAQTRQNLQSLAGAHAVHIQNIPLPELRRRQRQWIGHTDDTRPLIATGHQTELYHPGVWVKNVLINVAAERLDAAAYHLGIDTDSPKHLHLRWPGNAKPITDDPALGQAAWTGLLAPPTPEHQSFLAAEFDDAAAGWSFEPSIEPFFGALRRLSLEPASLCVVLINSIHQVEWELGLRHNALVTSPLWLSEPYLVYLHHVMARADSFAVDYNRALAEYRREHGIRTSARPMPDLQVNEGQVESPFWLDSLSTGTRQRASVQRRGDAWALVLANGDAFTFEAKSDGWEAAGLLLLWLRRNELRLAPRALTLTLFLRLLLADQFVHGIGGARYDQVTNRVIESHFGLAPPRFSVTTATLYFPAAAEQRRIDLRPLHQESRRIRHGLLNPDKRHLAQQIADLPRHSRERGELFNQMHLQLAAQSNSPAAREAERRLRMAEQERSAQRTLFDREFFFAIQPIQRLTDMIERYKAAFEEN